MPAGRATGTVGAAPARGGLLTRLLHRAPHVQATAPRPQPPAASYEETATPVAPRVRSVAAHRKARGISISFMPPQAGHGGISWVNLIHRCREVTFADCVFAVDGDGLVLAHEGSYGRAEVARVGAHLSRSFDFLDQLQEIGSEAECLCTMYPEGRWLTAVRISPRDGVVVTVGIIGPYTLIKQDRQSLRNTFRRLFEETTQAP